MSEEHKPFQILSLDGGGFKGIYSAAVLAHLEEDLDIRITDHFDLIAGTSTGGIIALGLGRGLRPREIVEFYVKHGHAIFKKNQHTSVRWAFKNKFDADALECAAKDLYKDRLLGSCVKRLVIPAYNLGEDDVYLFKTPHHPRLKRDHKEPLWKVAMATSAAPTYFPCFRGIDDSRLIDGGVWANNPTMVAIAEAVSMLDVPLSAIKVFSLGTTNPVKNRSSKLDKGGLLQWRKDAMNVALRGQSIGAVTQAQHLLGKDRVERLDPVVPDDLFRLDNVTKDELLSKAAHVSRNFSPTFSSAFQGHVAEEFKPAFEINGGA
jgi:patatin-like phospholipase/acyl hydrolase